MNDFFKDLFQYNQDCNQRLAALIVLHADKVSDKSLHLFSHILNAHHIWNSRIRKQPNVYDRLQAHSPQDFKQIDLDNHMRTLAIIDSGLLTEDLNYVNTKGEHAFNKVQDILFHVVNHSTYHRGQIASDLKQSGIEPLVTDFIFYKR
jgi:uncharacterized damage-inducible protein DinB